jgi:hypothetical protein
VVKRLALMHLIFCACVLPFWESSRVEGRIDLW